jgi:hypothetical protein
MIDWDLNRRTWNKDHKTDYKTRRELLIALYAEHKTYKKVGEVLCVAGMSVLRAIHEEGIQMLPRGHRFPSLKQQAVLALDTTNMYRWQIAERVGITPQHAWILLTRFKKKWKRLRN